MSNNIPLFGYSQDRAIPLHMSLSILDALYRFYLKIRRHLFTVRATDHGHK